MTRSQKLAIVKAVIDIGQWVILFLLIGLVGFQAGLIWFFGFVLGALGGMTYIRLEEEKRK